ncbi:MAG: hypothetical protein KF774_07880 [Planctomyces sp.]|nr:hypothetical protein [Planctomyces sp.]
MRFIVSRGWPVLAFLAVLSCAAQGLAQSEDEIEQARLKGVEYLKSTQLDDGSWEFAGHEAGITALCGMALVENGVPVTDRIITRAQSYVRSKASEQTNTYDVALTILFLSRMGDRDDRSLIRDLGARLLAGQNEEGGWSYNCPKVTATVLSDRSARLKPQPGTGDNSCTQFAVLGLWIASRWGVPVEDALEQAALRFIDTQIENGAWTYNYWDGKEGSQESMTYAGLFCLSVAKAAKIREQQSGRPPRRTLAARDVQKASNDKAKGKQDAPKGKADVKAPPANAPTLLTPGRPGAAPGTPAAPQEKPLRQPRLEARAAFEAATVLKDNEVFAKGLERAGQLAGGISPSAARYFLWSVERLGVMLEIEAFGDVDWFERGCQSLISAQQADGSWNGSWGNKSDTAFAILFLRRANLGSDISRLLAGEPEQKFVIASRPEHPRFATLAEAIAAAQPGDVIRIDGDGPYPMPHLEFSADLTIQAGPGYSPVLKYDVGEDANGRRSRPESDPDARHMARVNGGTLTLEGLELRADTPPLKDVVGWSGIVLNGGHLRLLNCSISEDRKNRMSTIRILKPGRASIRNSLLVGGEAAIRVDTAGDQQVSIENSIVYSDQALIVRPGSEPAGALQVLLARCAVQTNDAFDLEGVTTPVAITSQGVAYRAPWLGARMLPSADAFQNLTWTGSDNMFEVARWVGAGGAANSKVKDAKTFSDLLGGGDPKSQARPIPFSGKKPPGGYSHAIRAEDFEFAPGSAPYAYRQLTGIQPLIVGPGGGFLRFRDSFDYRAWDDEERELASR